MVKKTIAVIAVFMFFVLSTYLIGYEVAEQQENTISL